MKQIYLFIVCILFSLSLYAQDSMQVNTPPVSVEAPASHDSILSAQPTAQELADLFISACGGTMNPLDAVGLAAEKGESAVAGLTELLFSETIHGSKQPVNNPAVDTIVIYPNKLYPVLALDSIGTQNAIAALLRAADVHTNPEVRGFALNAIANQYCQFIDTSKAKRIKFQPDKMVIRILVNNAGDSTYIGYLQKTIDRIAHEALVQLLGMNFGDPQFKEARIKAAKGKVKMTGEQLSPDQVEGQPEETAANYARLWWNENEKNLSWNKETRHFSIDGK
jgi:hypothetical protein